MSCRAMRWGGLIAVLWVGGAFAQEAPPPAFHAVRTKEPIRLDGKVDEPAWREAPAFTQFVQSYPDPGAKPSQRTEARVLYDDANLYVAVICYDTEPGKITRTLGRRDQIPSSDVVIVSVDSQHDHRTAETFITNAGGVQADQLQFDDTNNSSSWNAVWDSAVASRPDGWSVEFAIPLHLLRFSNAAVQTWGFEIQRGINRTHEQIDSVLLPRSANAFVSLFGQLQGVRDLKPQRDLELTPYVAARSSLRPRYEDATRPYPRLFDPSMDIGLNLKASLGSDLTLNAALNPDFGEIEPDALQLNLTSYELFYPEMRPFFTEGLELFDSRAAGQSDQRLFYSRRIGLTAPLLGAAKLTGTVHDGLTMSVLDALVTGVGDPAKQPYAYGDDADPDQAPLDRKFEFHWQRPFHYGPDNELPAQRPVTTNYLALVARQKLPNASAVGLTVTSAAPLSKQCERSDFRTEAAYLAADCSASGGNAAAVDWNLRSPSGDWAAIGQVSASQFIGGPRLGVVREDGTVLHAGDDGFGGYLRVGKLGGEPWQFKVAYLYESPTLDLNPSGFQSNSNLHQLNENLNYTRPNGVGSLHSLDFWLDLQQSWSADGRGIPRYSKIDIGHGATLSNYFNYSVELGYERPQYDIREIDNTGIPFERNGDVYLAINGSTDSHKPLQVGGNLVGFPLVDKPYNGRWGYHATGWGRYRPTDNTETYLELSSNANPQGARYVDSLLDHRFVFAPQNPVYGSITFRQLWVINSKLTLQAYAQLFTAYAHYGPFYSASPGPDGKIRLEDLTPTAYGGPNPDFHTSALNVSVVARWEYRLGSTLFLVYSRSQQALPLPDGAAVPRTLYPENLALGPTNDTFLVKWSYWWDA